MTLREYLIKYNKDENRVIFHADYEVLYAETWDVEVFSLKFLKKSIIEANYEEIFAVYKSIIEFIRPVSLDEIISKKTHRGANRTEIGEGSFRKKKLHYDPNTYELTNDED